jgi:hypothetical protein
VGCQNKKNPSLKKKLKRLLTQKALQAIFRIPADEGLKKSGETSQEATLPKRLSDLK